MKTPARTKPNQLRMAKGIATFLEGMGVDTSDPNLTNTPERVAYAWATEFLGGYELSPAAVLSERFPAPRKADRELVVVTGLHFRSMCPHHLMPYSGTAHIAYVPGKWILGFGRIAALLNCYAQRLALQEDIARNVAEALTTYAQAGGSACIIQATQTCLTHRHQGEQHSATTHAEAYEGELKDGQLRTELWARIAKA